MPDTTLPLEFPMRSKAHINGHPLHPILVAFPIAFLTGAFVADAVGLLAGWPSLWTTGAYLNAAGLFTGLVAAVPGLIDYLKVVPPDSSAKRRATWHLAVNVTALGAYGLAWAFRDLATLTPNGATVALEGLGLALMTGGGYLGGTLVYRNQIGVDHRYAEAGKWHEETVEPRPGEPLVVAHVNELKVNQMKLLHVGERRIVLARTEEGYAAFDDRCTHRGGSLADGVLACGTVACPWHGSQFNVQTGQVKAGPAEQPISTYRIEQEGDQIRLILPSETARPPGVGVPGRTTPRQGVGPKS
jgi:nitrite reductase/ring-hydroxylating ferredoxin subunit/uncharacterized membrane protein